MMGTKATNGLRVLFCLNFHGRFGGVFAVRKKAPGVFSEGDGVSLRDAIPHVSREYFHLSPISKKL